MALGSLEPCTVSAGVLPAVPRASRDPGWPDLPFPRPDSALGPWSCCPVNRRFPEKGRLLEKGCLLHKGEPPSRKKGRIHCRADGKEIPTWKVKSSQAGLLGALLEQPSHGAGCHGFAPPCYSLSLLPPCSPPAWASPSGSWGKLPLCFSAFLPVLSAPLLPCEHVHTLWAPHQGQNLLQA